MFDKPITHRGLVVARGGAVAASQPLAVSAGIAALARGGTFADAAIATSAVLCVIEPQNSHLGGDAFLVVYDKARRETIAFNGSGEAPASATRESFPSGIPVRGIRAASVPGLVSTWFALHERFGRLPIAELLAPAIGYAADGYPVGPRVSRACQQNAALFHAHPSLHSLGIGPETAVGTIVVQPDLAETLRLIAKGGREAYYSGPIAEKIAAGSNGHFALPDLAAHKTRVIPPLRVPYRGLTVHGQPPPSQGHILLQELAIANGFDLAGMDTTQRLHVMVEAKKLAFADRNAYLADPEWRDVPMDALLSEEYAARRRALIRRDTAAPDFTAGNPNLAGSDTTYFLVSDGEGNAVSFIQSIFHGFGCAEVIPGTGILFNNRMTGFSLAPASPNVLEPGKRPAHTLNAWLATHSDGSLAYVGGTPGGHIQVQSNFQILVNLVDGGMDPQQAIEAPRWQHMNESASVSSDPSGPGLLEIEDRIGNPTITTLRQLGHTVRPIPAWGHGSSVQTLQVLPNGVVAVGSDPRCDGHAAGL